MLRILCKECNTELEATSSLDEDTILFKTEYDGMVFREEIRLIDENIRLRQTLGWKNNTVILAGQYYEKRKNA